MTTNYASMKVPELRRLLNPPKGTLYLKKEQLIELLNLKKEADKPVRTVRQATSIPILSAPKMELPEKPKPELPEKPKLEHTARRIAPENDITSTYQYEKTYEYPITLADGSTSIRRVNKKLRNPPGTLATTRGEPIDTNQLIKDFNAGLTIEQLKNKHHKGAQKIYDALEQHGLKIYHYNK